MAKVILYENPDFTNDNISPTPAQPTPTITFSDNIFNYDTLKILLQFTDGYHTIHEQDVDVFRSAARRFQNSLSTAPQIYSIQPYGQNTVLTWTNFNFTVAGGVNIQFNASDIRDENATVANVSGYALLTSSNSTTPTLTVDKSTTTTTGKAVILRVYGINDR